MNYNAPGEITRFLHDHDIALKKKWGQNFLVSGSVRERILDLLAPASSDFVWEIGPGLGAMTVPLLEKCSRVLAFEIDRGMIRSLEEIIGTTPALSICEGDFVKTFRAALTQHGRPNKILGNLPYASASKIILMLIETPPGASLSVFTVQKELAQRMCAVPGTKSYSSFSVICQYAFEIKHAFDVTSGAFFPRPDVVSSVVTLTPSPGRCNAIDERVFYWLGRAAFASRRKTLYNNLISAQLPEIGVLSKERILDALSRGGIAGNARAEELSVGQFITLAHNLNSNG